MTEHSYTVAVHDGGFHVAVTLPLSDTLTASGAHELARNILAEADRLWTERETR